MLLDGSRLERVHQVRGVDVLGALDHASIATGAEPDRVTAQDLLLKPFARQMHEPSRRVIHVKGQRTTAAAQAALQAMADPLASHCVADPMGKRRIALSFELHDPLDFHRFVLSNRLWLNPPAYLDNRQRGKSLDVSPPAQRPQSPAPPGCRQSRPRPSLASTVVQLRFRPR